VFPPLASPDAVEWALLNCASVGGADPDKDLAARYEFGRALVMTNDLLLTEGSHAKIHQSRVSKRRRLIALQLQLGSSLEINNPPAIEQSLVRTDMMFGEIAARIQLPINVKEVFVHQTGLELDTYVDMVFGLLAYYLTHQSSDFADNPSKLLLNPDTFFRNAPAFDVQKFFEMELGTIEDAAHSLSRPSVLVSQHDFIAFRKKPLLGLTQTAAICINPAFLQEKVDTGLFWSIFNSLKTKSERDALFEAWGLIFEQYITWLTSEPFEGKPERFVPFPRFEDNNDEAFDGIILTDDTWFVMEYKGGFLRADAKYAENEDALIRDLALKFGRDRGAGVEQLARKIFQVFNAKPTQKRKLRGLDSSRCRVVVPILVVQEPFVSSPLISRYLCGEFRSAKSTELSKRITCAGLQILDVGELEGIRPYIRSGQIGFNDCLMGRARLGDNAPPFGEYFAGYFRSKRLTGVRDYDFETRSKSILDRVSTRFFGHDFSRSH
jgi:hypothetical protein